ncbi:PilN domain-containing protein [Salinicola avicenniae]|uniref:PilN domain-containing protein n=1 Tax=Salinicola avicenniae TaxID=2916836 RepID=UPI00207466C5|nr:MULTISPECIES: PilN domain-containing protein [unclassified Salinicola]
MTIEINLLPWRERQRQQRTRRFQQLLFATLLLGLLGGWLIAQYEQAQVRAQQARLAMVQRDAEALNSDIQAVRDYRQLRERMLEQIELITALQASRPGTVRVFDQLAATLVDGVHFTELSRHDRRLELNGVALANRQVSDQMRALERSPVFGVPLLSDVQSGESPGAPKRFHMSVEERRLPSQETTP